MSELNDKLLEIKRQKDTYILPENLKKDVTAFGVTGALESGAKIFDTIEDMQQDETAQEGDLAIVYREEIQPVTEESEFSSCIFPNEVVLSEAFTGSISGAFNAADPSVIFAGTVNMSSSRFRFTGWSEGGSINVQYTSSDGITYTRTDGGEELQEFGTTIKWESWGDPFDNVIGNFMKIGGNHFEGLYEYKAFKNKNKIHIYSYSELAWDNSTRKLTGTGGEVIEFDIEATLNKITEYTETNFSDYRTGTYYGNPIYEYMIYYDNNCIVFPFVTQNEGSPKFLYNLNLLVDNTTWKATGGIIITNPSVTYNLHEIRVNITTGQLSYALLQENFTNEIYQPLTRFNNYKFVGNIDKDGVFNYEYQNGLTTILYYSNEASTWYESNCIYGEKPGIDDIKYLFTDTQLNATADDVYEKTFYGKNGTESGTLTTNISNSFADINAEVYAKIQAQYDNMQPRILTDQDKDIDSDIRIIPSRSDGTSLLDTSNVTDMSNMFSSCRNLINIPLLDTSNATNMKYMFIDCENLITVPNFNTLNVTNMYGIFNGCKNLTIVPNFNTSNVTDMTYMFEDCTSLTTIPLLDTSNVTNMQYMFSYCKNLTTVPNFNTSKVTNMYYMFNSCNNLSNESLNNILAMCANSALTANKKLKYIGLTQEQATTCTTLSNYQAFVNAGWTTGY